MMRTQIFTVCLFAMALLFLNSIFTAAQETVEPAPAESFSEKGAWTRSLAGNIDFSAAGGFMNLNKSDLSEFGFGLGVGYRAPFGLYVYVPLQGMIQTYNQNTDRNYNTVGYIGGGLGYRFDFKNGMDRLEVDAKGMRSVVADAFHSVKASFSARYGLQLNRFCNPYVGLGFDYIHPLKTDRKDAYMFGVSVGIWLF